MQALSPPTMPSHIMQNNSQIPHHGLNGTTQSVFLLPF